MARVTVEAATNDAPVVVGRERRAFPVVVVLEEDGRAAEDDEGAVAHLSRVDEGEVLARLGRERAVVLHGVGQETRQ